jgi:hypothetical protein
MWAWSFKRSIDFAWASHSPDPRKSIAESVMLGPDDIRTRKIA